MPSFNHQQFNPQTKRDYNAERPLRKTYQHLYNTTRWRRLRNRQLQQTPYCQQCYRNTQQYVYANVADHITDHRGDDRLMWDPGNLQSLCRECHDRKNGLTLQAKKQSRRSRSKRIKEVM